MANKQPYYRYAQFDKNGGCFSDITSLWMERNGIWFTNVVDGTIEYNPFLFKYDMKSGLKYH